MAVFVGSMVLALVAGPAAGAAAPAVSLRPGDGRLLAAGVVTAGDVPASWQPSRQSNDLKAFSGIPTCRRIYAVSVAANRAVPNVLSRQFTDPASNQETTASDQVFAFRTVRAASAYLVAFEGPNVEPCLNATLQRVLAGSGVTNTTAASAPITTLTGVGDASTGQQITVSAQASGQVVTLVADFEFVRVGRAVMLFEFLHADTTLPEGPQIVTSVVGRVQAAA